MRLDHLPTDLRRTRGCGEFRPEHAGSRAVVMGWVARRRRACAADREGGGLTSSGLCAFLGRFGTEALVCGGPSGELLEEFFFGHGFLCALGHIS